MNERIRRLRDESFDTHPSIDIERALLETEFYRENEGKLPMPVLRAANFKHICENKTIYIGPEELIVGEREGRLDLPRTHLPLKARLRDPHDARPAELHRRARGYGNLRKGGRAILARTLHERPPLRAYARRLDAPL